jgi:hypothetical protein
LTRRMVGRADGRKRVGRAVSKMVGRADDSVG